MPDKEEQVAHSLIQAYIDADHRVMNLEGFYRALVQALKAAHYQGWNDHALTMRH
jgi:hypothetical protein